MKGLIRSIRRGDPLQRSPANITIMVDAVLTATGATGVAVFNSVQIGSLPEGNILIHGAAASLEFAGPGSADLADTWTGNYGIGSVANANNTLTATDINFVTSTAIGPAVAEFIAAKRGAAAVASIIDNTASTQGIWLNALFAADVITNAATVSVTAKGFVHLLYTVLGDD